MAGEQFRPEDDTWGIAFELRENADGTVTLLRRVGEFPTRKAAEEYMLATAEKLQEKKQ